MLTIKICGVRTPEAAHACVAAKATYAGLTFVPQSRRVISIKTAQSICALLGPTIPVALFYQASIEHILETVKQLDCDHVQLHGDEAPEATAKLQSHGLVVIKAFSVGSDFNPAILRTYVGAVDHIILDAPTPGQGHRITNPRLSDVEQPFWLAGGLTPENVGSALEHPYISGVDTASGIETDGLPDPARIIAFCHAARAARGLQ